MKIMSIMMALTFDERILDPARILFLQPYGVLPLAFITLDPTNTSKRGSRTKFSCHRSHPPRLLEDVEAGLDAVPTKTGVTQCFHHWTAPNYRLSRDS